MIGGTGNGFPPPERPEPEPFEVGEEVDVLLTVEVRTVGTVQGVNDDGTADLDVDATRIGRPDSSRVVDVTVMRRPVSEPEGL